jgi:NAD(P)-dependent dehydrogenase (short-subunit alcohol dehydrogenase family)
MRLNSKNAVITGGASGIGRAICRVFANEGASIVIADIDERGGSETADLIIKDGGTAIFIPTDVSSIDSVDQMVDACISSVGSIDILVNDAAAFVFGTIETVSPTDWEKVFGVNVLGTANTVKSLLPYLKDASGASIVNIASVSSFIAQPAFVPYNTSKGAVIQLTRCLALDLAEYDIRVNCVCPGTILTPATDRHIAFEGIDRDEFLKTAGDRSFLKRLGTPDEVAYAALFLASDEASFITGTQIVVDGGATV